MPRSPKKQRELSPTSSPPSQPLTRFSTSATRPEAELSMSVVDSSSLLQPTLDGAATASAFTVLPDDNTFAAFAVPTPRLLDDSNSTQQISRRSLASQPALPSPSTRDGRPKYTIRAPICVDDGRSLSQRTGLTPFIMITMVASPKTRTTNGKHIYGRAVSLAEALEYFCAEKDIEFDHLYPVYDPPDGQVTELPVKEMNAVNLAFELLKEGSRHDFVMMMRWLQTSMEISEVSCLSIQISIICSHVRRPILIDRTRKYRHFKDRLAFLDAYLGHIRQSWMYT
ncbi:hypothetical protein GQ600_1620 [Phytophthora cactorum]|nr:hypothetical protein GQ600_1620 [Phytophthora cactorum]